MDGNMSDPLPPPPEEPLAIHNPVLIPVQACPSCHTICQYALYYVHHCFIHVGTHDVQNITVVTVDDGIQIEGHYIDNSESKGLLVIVYNTHDPNKYPPQYYSIRRHRIGPKRWKIRQNLTDIGAGEWLVSVFVVEKDRLPFYRVATPPKAVLIPNSSSKLAK